MNMNEIPNYYSITPATVRYSTDLSPQEKLLYSEITALTNYKGYCWATNNYFAGLYHLSKETISRQISKLAKFGFIHVEIIYFENSNQIKERRLYLTTPDIYKTINDINTPIDENINTPIDENINTPIDENVKDNNISINNINMNKSMSKSMSKSDKKTEKTKRQKPDMTVTVDSDPITQLNISENEKGLPQTYALEADGLQSPNSNPYPNNNTTETYNQYLKRIKENIQYDYFVTDKKDDLDMVDAILACMTEMLANQNKYIKINKDISLPKNIVISILMKIDVTHMQHMVHKIKSVKKPITNISPYIKTCIASVLQEMDIHDINLYNRRN